jgi:hypothetical protein
MMNTATYDAAKARTRLKRDRYANSFLSDSCRGVVDVRALSVFTGLGGRRGSHCGSDLPSISSRTPEAQGMLDRVLRGRLRVVAAGRP